MLTFSQTGWFNMFKVIFKASESVLYGLTNCYGTDFIDSVREEFKIKCDDYSKFEVNTSCPHISRKEYLINVDFLENINIKDIHHFKAKNVIYVQIPNGFLGQYLKVEVDSIIETRFGGFFNKIEGYQINFTIDEHKLLQEWIDDNCPLEWKINEKEYSKKNFLYKHFNKIYLNSSYSILNIFDIVYTERHPYNYQRLICDFTEDMGYFDFIIDVEEFLKFLKEIVDNTTFTKVQKALQKIER